MGVTLSVVVGFGVNGRLVVGVAGCRVSGLGVVGADALLVVDELSGLALGNSLLSTVVILDGEGVSMVEGIIADLVLVELAGDGVGDGWLVIDCVVDFSEVVVVSFGTVVVVVATLADTVEGRFLDTSLKKQIIFG